MEISFSAFEVEWAALFMLQPNSNMHILITVKQHRQDFSNCPCKHRKKAPQKGQVTVTAVPKYQNLFTEIVCSILCILPPCQKACSNVSFKIHVMMAKFTLTILLNVDYSFKKGICLHLKYISTETTTIHLHIKDTLSVACIHDLRLLAFTFSLGEARCRRALSNSPSLSILPLSVE